ncbi:hypothetical protein E3U23_13240 [Erythrobacter litoralis]|uniref:hypothetical protein n=1 Tax=Erythrobacter litoralis TaxID=39960 RepID=UPI0024360166|nr:hypothetical protein [Erythrobacter litoralis]MDG6080153.1 hypothetical protein [Erythrobacter litoralis]
MKRLMIGAAMIAMPLPAAAQDAQPAESEALTGLQATLTDPAKQQEIAATLRVLGEVLLDLPLASLAGAARNITGEEVPKVSPDTTLRSMAPQASRLPEQLEENAPRAMAAMGDMSRALETMLPALRDMAKRLEETVPAADRP